MVAPMGARAEACVEHTLMPRCQASCGTALDDSIKASSMVTI
jgi:hypothetical protein